MSEKTITIGKLIIDNDKEIINKIIREILLLFRLYIPKTAVRHCDYSVMEIKNTVTNAGELKVNTRIYLTTDDRTESLQQETAANSDENPKAAVNRLIKWNLYHLLKTKFGKVTAPWGILHGVRPAKIVHRYIASGMPRETIIRRFIDDYAVSPVKAALLTDIAYRQLPTIASSDASTISIYIGIPFCLSRCLYCSFPSNLLPDETVLNSFMAALHKEVISLQSLIIRYKLKVQTIYIGGGTPTSLPEKYFAALLKYAASLKTVDTVEFNVEAGRPDSITQEKILLMNKYCVNRISVNPQTMQERTLNFIGRKHTPQDIIDVYHVIRRMSSAKINMDLILGLPGESDADTSDTIKKVIGLAPDDITVHALAIKKGSALKLNKSDITLPNDAVVQKMAHIVENALRRSDYQPYYLYRQGYMSGQLENTGYCKKDAASIYNIQIMSEHQTILGIGGNASTKIVAPAGTYLKTLFNPKNLAAYLKSVDDYIMRRVSLMEEVYGK
ncbi:coproporphyrinogen dehydrogenase HemZ [Pectinatus frisingensis]|uniref:coproporphyrinogen dehydrogenase HemZ n=1 Tax=Pectinatus frisingensis TaxID=865 RepID=UPI0018C6A726|nr:coproporphyrinogen dehydrogenase HemZ [Pectinatus frisingensis]